VHASPPSDAWREVALAPFACFEDDARASLPLEIHGVRVEAVDASAVSVSIAHGRAEVPRHWLARMLFRLALHGYRLGYLETYGGFYYDDRDGFRLGLRGADSVALTREQMAEVVETVYRAVAPEGYVERVA
jgi:hypothetical protein